MASNSLKNNTFGGPTPISINMSIEQHGSRNNLPGGQNWAGKEAGEKSCSLLSVKLLTFVEFGKVASSEIRSIITDLDLNQC